MKLSKTISFLSDKLSRELSLIYAIRTTIKAVFLSFYAAKRAFKLTFNESIKIKNHEKIYKNINIPDAQNALKDENSAASSNIQKTKDIAAVPAKEQISEIVPTSKQIQIFQKHKQYLSYVPYDELLAFIESFIKSQNSTHTKRAYVRDLTDFAFFLKKTNSALTVHALIEYRDYLQKQISVRTGNPISNVSINRKIACIKSFLNWLVMNGVIPNNPAKAVKSFRAGRESPTRDIPDDMVVRILNLPNSYKLSGSMHKTILVLLFRLGIRRGELIDIRTSDLFEQEGINVIRIRGKGDKERILPLPDDVKRNINQYLLMSGKNPKIDQLLFTPVKNNFSKIKNKRLHPHAVTYILKRYAKKAGVSYKVSPHCARATAVSNALDNQATHRAVQYMAGWSSPLMVGRYDKRKENLKNSAVKNINYN